MGTDLGIGLDPGPGENRGEDVGGQVTSSLGADSRDAEASVDAIFITEEAHGPETHRSIGVGQRGDGASVVEGIDLRQRPESAQGAAALVSGQQRIQLRDRRRVSAFGQQLQRGRTVELIGMPEQGHQLGGRLALEVRVGLELGVLVAEAV